MKMEIRIPSQLLTSSLVIILVCQKKDENSTSLSSAIKTKAIEMRIHDTLYLVLRTMLTATIAVAS